MKEKKRSGAPNETGDPPPSVARSTPPTSGRFQDGAPGSLATGGDGSGCCAGWGPTMVDTATPAPEAATNIAITPVPIRKARLLPASFTFPSLIGSSPRRIECDTGPSDRNPWVRLH